MVPAVSSRDVSDNMRLSIAIDGPAGSGKTTVARLVAGRLGYLYVDTGAMYRAVTLRLLRQGTPLLPSSLLPVLYGLDVRLDVRPGNGYTRVWLDGQDVSQAIRGPRINSYVSEVSANPMVRRAMVAIQRRLALLGPVVMEGRDVGSVVLPQAGTRVYLTAALRHRAWRRYREMVSAAGRRVTTPLGQYWAIRRRDRYDRGRADSPLTLAPGATLIDSGRLTAAEVADCIVILHRVNTGGGAG